MLLIDFLSALNAVVVMGDDDNVVVVVDSVDDEEGGVFWLIIEWNILSLLMITIVWVFNRQLVCRCTYLINKYQLFALIVNE